jgi:Trk-type K+ transport system membrane component
VVLYATLNEQLYGGPTPWSAVPAGASATGADTVVEHLERLPRLVTLWLELLRWAPAFALVFYAAWLLRRSREERLARVVPERESAEAAAMLALAVVAAMLLVAAFLVPTTGYEYLVPALPVAGALVAWGLRHAPRPGAVLGAVTLAITAYQLLSS